MSKWKELASKNHFKPNQEIASPLDPEISPEQASVMESAIILSTDGREIPVLVDPGTRSVYPIRGE